ncbi:phosphotransferase family protein [Brevibacillus choshinensis]|uniref:phosphotransferase family protein n=1 Tax=Brevibacillus choshinensis TaxID=54911 RepID=UPI002E1FAA65|nr:phosphotransferase [Brevibacillus choshinensis]
MEGWLQHLMETSPGLQKANKIERILKGFSPELKYRVFLTDGTERLLRVSEKSAWEQKKAEYAILQTLQSMDVKASRPIELGVLDESSQCYMLLTYLAGEDAKDALIQLTEGEQYEIGREAGKELATMHTISAHPSVPDWYERCIQKHNRYVAAYKDCGYQIPYAERILLFIEKNMFCLKDTPNRFLHDDFHVGNLIVHERKYAGAIDFNRFDWGDPAHDFTKLAFFSREISIPYSIGQLVGYDERTGGLSESFWIRYCVYTAMAMFSSVVWTIQNVPDQIKGMLERIERISHDHDYFERLTPAWYHGD